MGSELLDEPSESPSPLTDYTEVFEAQFPYYLSLGMSYDDYWHNDPSLVRHYREANELRRRRFNQESWWQGAYFYNALMAGLSALGKDQQPYMSEPIPLTEKERAEQKEREYIAMTERLKADLMGATRERHNSR